MVKLQSADDTLAFIRDKAKTGEVKECKDGSSVKYMQKNNLYYRLFQPTGKGYQVYTQLIIQLKLRNEVMRLAHDGIMTEYLGIMKTTEKILNEFFWPAIRKDVQAYCKTCDIWQKTIPKGRIHQLPLGKMSIIHTQFSCIAIDIVGPIYPH